MAGIFRSNSLNPPQPIVESTPNKRFSFSAFCTSPRTLQDVTMENSYSVGYRSPCVTSQPFHGHISPQSSQGRSVREFDEQMSSLRKENFNLKLRLYFIEENIPGFQAANTGDGQESVLKKLVDLKVESEVLRKELNDKQNLLKDAAVAFNQMELLQKETETKNQEFVAELKQRIQCLEIERDIDKTQNGEYINRSDIAGTVNALQKIRDLEDQNQLSDITIIDLKCQIAKKEEVLLNRDETIKEYEEKVKELVLQNSELLDVLETKESDIKKIDSKKRHLKETNEILKEDNIKLIAALKTTQENMRDENIKIKTCALEKEAAINSMEELREELHEQKTQLADKLCMLQDAEEELKNRNQIHEQACRTIQKLMQNIKHQQGEIQRLKEQNATNNNEHPNGSGSDGSGMCRSVSDSEVISDSAGRQMQKIIEEQENTIKELRAEVKKKTANLQNLVNKELWEKNREIERLTKVVNKRATSAITSPPTGTHTSAHELQKSFSEIDYAKAVERNQLLQRKVDILIQRVCMVHHDEALVKQLRKQVREARTNADSAEKWRRECAEVCAVLTKRLEELAGFLHTLLKHKDVLGVLAADRRRAIRKAVDRSLDLSKSLNMTLSASGVSMCDGSFAQLSNLSLMLGDAEDDAPAMDEAEAEAEADNGEGGDGAQKTFNSHEAQSIESLRAENKALKTELETRRSADAKKERRSLPLQAPPPPPSLEHNNHSESEAWSEPDRKVSMARIGLDEHSASLTKDTAATSVCRRTGGATDTESDAEKNIRNVKPAPTRSQDRISQLELMIAHRDARILDVQCQLVDTDNRLKYETLHVLELSQELEQLRMRNDELHADLVAIGTNDWNPESGEQQRLLRQLEEKTAALEWAQKECGRITSVTAIAEAQINSLNAEIDRLQQQHQRAEALADEQEQQRLQQLRREMEALLQQRLTEREQEYQEALSRDWIARSVYEECKQQLLELQRQYAEQQRNVDYMQESEQELKKTLLDNEHAERALKKQLDESTLQASRAVLERTKALSEKLQLEKRTEQLGSQLAAHESERRTLQQHVEQLEQQIAEAATARLNGSDMSQSGGYTSEEIVQQDGNQMSAATLTAATTNAATDVAIGAQRLHNSSPDLGIESDAGRASSAELANVQRPLHKTVVLPTDDIKDDIKDIVQAELDLVEGKESSAVEHDCVKVEQECAEMRRKLTRLKRAFEETCEKLRVSNQRKAQVEKDIKNQILKTHNVLKTVRANMENEL